MLRMPIRTAVLLGKENAGKTQLAAALAGTPGAAANCQGATAGCDSYRVGNWELIDTPGLLPSSAGEPTRPVAERLRDGEAVLLVAREPNWTRTWPICCRSRQSDVARWS